ncbi:MAG TPA: hypothetical protein VGJ95_00315 [Pseudonocardiaceae bacterium]
MTNEHGRGHVGREQRAAAKRAQLRPSLDHLVEVVRATAGDQIAEEYRRLQQQPVPRIKRQDGD